jgi:hypothetical protein
LGKPQRSRNGPVPSLNLVKLSLDGLAKIRTRQSRTKDGGRPKVYPPAGQKYRYLHQRCGRDSDYCTRPEPRYILSHKVRLSGPRLHTLLLATFFSCYCSHRLLERDWQEYICQNGTLRGTKVCVTRLWNLMCLLKPCSFGIKLPNIRR